METIIPSADIVWHIARPLPCQLIFSSTLQITRYNRVRYRVGDTRGL